MPPTRHEPAPLRVRAGWPTRSERGAVAVEFALVVPLLMVLLFGIISYGYMLSFRQAVSQSAAEGARTAAVLTASVADAERATRTRAAVNQGLAAYDVECAANGTLVSDGDPAGTCTIGARRPCSNDAASECVEVGVDYTYRDDPLIPSFPGLGLVLPEHLAYSTEAQVS